MAVKVGTLPAITPQVCEHDRFGKIRVIGDSDNPLFCLSDACKMLGLPQVAKVVQRLGKDVLSTHPLETAGGVQQMYFVNEDGFYDLILESRKPEARTIRKWLTSEVMPSLRKTGMYINPNAPINPDLLIKIGQDMKALAAQRDEALAQVAELKPKADYCELILQSNEALPVTVIAKDYGMGGAQFNELLSKLKIQYKVGKTWVLYQPYANMGYATTETKILRNGLTVTITRWTQKGRMFLYGKLKEIHLVPVVERTEPMATLPGMNPYTWGGGYAPRVM